MVRFWLSSHSSFSKCLLNPNSSRAVLPASSERQEEIRLELTNLPLLAVRRTRNHPGEIEFSDCHPEGRRTVGQHAARRARSNLRATLPQRHSRSKEH